MPQLIRIHWWNAFVSDEHFRTTLEEKEVTKERIQQRMWWDTFRDDLWGEFDVLEPHMPSSDRAVYGEWKIYFEKVLTLVDDWVILMGHSLWAIFLIKYLSEHTCPKIIQSLFLLSPALHEDPDDPIVSFVPGRSFDNISKQVSTIHILHSKDDFICPYADAVELHEELPWSHMHTFEDRNHFLQKDIPELMNLLHEQIG